jgi:hypothetical protein
MMSKTIELTEDTIDRIAIAISVEYGKGNLGLTNCIGKVLRREPVETWKFELTVNAPSGINLTKLTRYLDEAVRKTLYDYMPDATSRVVLVEQELS